MENQLSVLRQRLAQNEKEKEDVQESYEEEIKHRHQIYLQFKQSEVHSHSFSLPHSLPLSHLGEYRSIEYILHSTPTSIDHSLLSSSSPRFI